MPAHDMKPFCVAPNPDIPPVGCFMVISYDDVNSTIQRKP